MRWCYKKHAYICGFEGELYEGHIILNEIVSMHPGQFCLPTHFNQYLRKLCLQLMLYN